MPGFGRAGRPAPVTAPVRQRRFNSAVSTTAARSLRDREPVPDPLRPPLSAPAVRGRQGRALPARVRGGHGRAARSRRRDRREPRGADLREHGRGPGAQRTGHPQARQHRVLQQELLGHRRRHQRHRDRDQPQARRARRQDPPQRRTVRTHRDALAAARKAGPGRAGRTPPRALPHRVRPRRRRARHGRARRACRRSTPSSRSWPPSSTSRSSPTSTTRPSTSPTSPSSTGSARTRSAPRRRPRRTGVSTAGSSPSRTSRATRSWRTCGTGACASASTRPPSGAAPGTPRRCCA